MVAGADPTDVCGALSWACSTENTFANVSEACTDELSDCCNDVLSCHPATLFSMNIFCFYALYTIGAVKRYLTFDHKVKSANLSQFC